MLQRNFRAFIQKRLGLSLVRKQISGRLRSLRRGSGHGSADSVLRASDLFDPAYYLSRYPDVQEAGIDPVTHYLEFGWKEGRRPSLRFDGRWYLRHYADVRQSNVNPLVHYLKHG